MVMRQERQLIYDQRSKPKATDTGLEMVVDDIKRQCSGIPNLQGKQRSDEAQSILIVSYMTLHLFRIAGSEVLVVIP